MQGFTRKREQDMKRRRGEWAPGCRLLRHSRLPIYHSLHALGKKGLQRILGSRYSRSLTMEAL